MIVYIVENQENGRVYVGQTRRTLEIRKCQHEWAALRGNSMTPFHCAIRKYGAEAFIWHEYIRTNDLATLDYMERLVIANECPHRLYNVEDGGHTGSSGPLSEEHKAKMREARKGGRPALGMKHSEAVKEIMAANRKKRWGEDGKFTPQMVAEIVTLGFAEAVAKFGISKTHYYRLKRRQDHDG